MPRTTTARNSLWSLREVSANRGMARIASAIDGVPAEAVGARFDNAQVLWSEIIAALSCRGNEFAICGVAVLGCVGVMTVPGQLTG